MERSDIITLIIILVAIIIVFTILYFEVGKYFYGVAIDPKIDKTYLLNKKQLSYEEEKERESQKKWLKEKSEEINIESSNNGELKLHSYKIKAEQESSKWVIAIHGYTSEGEEMTPFAQKFYERGYNVLLPDLRGHGKSEGDYIGMGWHDRLDIIDWINYLTLEKADNEIILYGISMGAATVMMTAGEDLPKNVKVAIEDCGYTSVWDELKYQLKNLYHLPAFPILYAANRSCKSNANYSFKEASAIEQVKKSEIPILFIHGDEDKFVPFEMLDELYDAADCKKEKLVIEGAEHGKSSSKNPELYWKTIDDFIDKYMNNINKEDPETVEKTENKENTEQPEAAQIEEIKQSEVNNENQIQLQLEPQL